MKPTRFFFALACLLGATLARADDTQTAAVSIPNGGKASVRLPAAWKYTAPPESSKPASTLRITDAANTLLLQITFLADPDGRFAKGEALDAAVTKTGQHYLPGAVEKEITLTHYTSEAGKGCYTIFTDKDLVNVARPRAGQFRKVLTGVFSFGKQAAIFTLDSNDTDSPEYRQALGIVTGGIAAL